MESQQINDLPKMLRYKQIKPKGYPTRQRRVEINQLNNQDSYSFNDTVKFQFQTNSYIDPYDAYIEIQVEVPQSKENMPAMTSQYQILDGGVTNSNTTTYSLNKKIMFFPDFSNVPLYLLDGPATSFISEMIIYSNGREVEKIQEYDQLGMLIADLGINLSQRAKSGYYGLASQFGKSDYSYLSQQINNFNRNPDQMGKVYYGKVGTSGIVPDDNNVQTEQVSYLMNNNIVNNDQNYNYVSSVGPSFINTQLETQVATYFNMAPSYVSPINDYLDIPLVTTTTDGFYRQTANNYVKHGLYASINSNHIQQSTQYNKHPGLFQTTQYQHYYDYLDGRVNKIQDSKISDIFVKPSCYVNYAREFALQDGQYGIEHYDTISITPFQAKNDGYQTGIYTTGGSNLGNRTGILHDLAVNKAKFTNVGSTIALLTPTDINQSGKIQLNSYKTQGRDYINGTPESPTDPSTLDRYDTYQTQCETLKRRKKILYNAASNQNNFTYFAPGIMQARWINGKPQTKYNVGGHNVSSVGGKEKEYSMTKKTFYVPIYSALLGHLIPQDQWKLIPGAGCGVLNFEFRLNRYAMFMSGHKANDGTNIDPTSDYQFHNGEHGWKIRKMSLHFTLWDFPESVNQIVDQQLQTGIVMNTQAFIQCAPNQIQNTQAAKGNWKVNVSAKSIKKIYVWYLLDDYQKYNFCRKNYRISHNLRSIQLKIGQEYIPEQPVRGHAGNLFELNDTTTGDVYPFYIELLRTHGEMFCEKGKINILPQNFIVNERAYIPSQSIQSQFQTAFLHETRLVGKAIYTIDLEADPFDNDTLTGKDTSQLRPFEIVIDTHSQDQQTRSSTMYTLLHCDMLVQFTKDGIITAF